MDGAGKIIRTEFMDNKTQIAINVADLARGLYIVEVAYRDGMDQKWLVVNR